MHKCLILAVVASAIAVIESFESFDRSNCTDNEFTCGNLQCVDHTKHCDGIIDCTDASDEMDCDMFLCKPPNYFRCKNLRCLSSAFVCDQENDCDDYSDEENCEEFKKLLQKNTTCEQNQWQCSDKLCIYLDWVCDGKPDCLDGSDEILGCSADIKCDGFKCKNGHCIPHEWRCDNNDDCRDNSDELNCPIVAEPSECTIDTDRFLCKDGNTCIHLNQVCDGTKNCPDYSDEGPLCNKTCDGSNCSHKCVLLPTGPKCVCPQGYHTINEKHCQDINECEVYGICDQKCKNLPGSYECLCEENYTLRPDKKTCKSHLDEAIMFFSSKKEIRAYLLKSELYFPVIKNLKQAIGVEFDGHYVYWTEIFSEHESIVRSLKNGTKKELLVTSGLGAPEDLHIDWWTGNIYFTDAERQHIGVCTGDGKHCTVLINKDIHKPRGIVLNPKDGEMYWTDWGNHPEIARAFMDGSNDTSFVSTDIHWPNGLAIDYFNERLYWTDAKIMTLESIRLDGTDRRIVLQGVVKHPYAVAVFENRLYWSDWATHSIQSCEKFTGKDHQTIIKETKDFVYDITIYHPNTRKKPQTNPCASSFCSDICLLSSYSTYTCACPQDKVLSLDRHTCKDAGTRQKLILGGDHMLIHIEHQLLGRHDLTALPIFIKKVGALAYNGKENILYVSDLEIHKIISVNLLTGTSKELQIPDIEEVVAMDYDYLGNNLYWCDSSKKTVEVLNLNTNSKKVLLHDMNGELPESIVLIPEEGVMFVAFQKSNKQESHIDSFLMDGSARTHSIDHGIVGPVTLLYDHDLHRIFFADSGTGNIESTSTEGDDRHGFRSLQTSPVGLTSLKRDIFWVNKNSRKIFWADKYNTGDGDYNKKVTLDLPEEIERMHLISISRRHAGLSPCQNTNCSHLCLLSKKSVVCACPTGLELGEDGRTCTSPVRCLFDEFHCGKSNVCILNKFHCDGTKNCPHGEDEENCNVPSCSLGDFRCRDGTCIKQTSRCDRRYDCVDKSDEEDCDHQLAKSCPPNYFRCGDGQCIKDHFVCDGLYDCTDREDELNCVASTCKNSDFRCLSGFCIPKNWECDGDYDCPDMSDEHKDCKTCSSDMFTCINGKCIDRRFVCNQENDCGDDSDETFCLQPQQSCSVGEFTCFLSANVCLPLSARCNDVAECPHGEDEQNCTSCHGEEFQCRNNRCVPKQWTCDHFDDCGDNSDEASSLCSHSASSTKSLMPCHNGFRCDSGKCIDIHLVCNGEADCYDGSDENGLCNTSCSAANNPCQQLCLKTPKGPVCQCHSGFRLQADGHGCEDVNECEAEPPVCSQICHNAQGTHSCHCYPGFVIRADRTSCKAEGKAMAVMYTSDNQIRELSQTANSLKLIHSEETPRITSLDVDVKSNTIYFTIDDSDSILRVNSDGSVHEYIRNSGKPHVLSLDWLTNNVYYANNEPNSRSISVCNFDDKSCLDLIRIDLHRQVSAIAVDAVNGVFFYALVSWWMFNSPTYIVYKANLDGSNKQELVKSSKGFIAGLAFDLYKKELYYVDQYNGELGQMSYDGTERAVLIANLTRPVGLNFFENHLYVLMAGGVVKKCRFYTATICDTFPLPSYSSSLFVIVQESRQPQFETSPCQNHNCTYICVPAKTDYRCLCKDWKLVGPGQLCEDGKREATAEDRAIVGIHFDSHSYSEVRNGPMIAGVTILICLLVIAGVAYYMIKKRNRGTFRISMRFHNPVYGLRSNESQKNILQPGQHEYTNPVDFNQTEPDNKRESLLIDV